VFTHLVNMSYTIMFAINATLLLVAIIYSLVWLKWQTSPRQQPLLGTNWLLDFFDMRHVASTIQTLTKPRRNHGKLHLWLLLLAMCLYTFQRDEKSKTQMYTSLMFNWTVVDFSNFKTFQSTLFVLGQFDSIQINRIATCNANERKNLLSKSRKNFHFRLYDPIINNKKNYNSIARNQNQSCKRLDFLFCKRMHKKSIFWKISHFFLSVIFG